MIFLLPALGIIFLFIGILIFALLFINSSPRSTGMYENYHNEDMLYNPHYGKLSKSQAGNTNVITTKASQLEGESYYLRERINRELDKKAQLNSAASAYIITMTFSLLLYLAGGITIFYYFQDSWNDLNWQKIAFLVFYAIGFLLFISSLVSGINAKRSGNYSSHHMVSRHYPYWTNLSLEQSINALSEEFRVLSSINMNKERHLQTAKYLFIFSFCNIFIIALILLMQFYGT